MAGVPSQRSRWRRLARLARPALPLAASLLIAATAPTAATAAPPRALAGAAGTEDPPVPAEPAKARLVADTKAFAPGSTFRLGVLFTIDPEWHVYWHSARDGGLPTEVTWKLPEGWRAGPLEWPAPERFVLPGPLVAYGYEKEVLLASEITVPAGFSASEPVTLGAEVHWLVCKVVCVIGKGEPSLALGAGTPAPSAEAPRFAAFRAKVPVPPARAGIAVEDSFERAGATGTWRIVLTFGEGGKPPSEKQISAFPFDPPGARLDEGRIEAEGTRRVITFQAEITGAEFRPEKLGAVLLWPAAEGGDRPPVAIEVRPAAAGKSADAAPGGGANEKD